MSVPTGTLTFLFTDIEGSTKLWAAHPESMRAAVARHDALLRRAVTDNNGYLFKTTGDGIAAVFALATDALAAALAAQQVLLAELWPEQTVLRSRMGLHTGAAELRDGDYFGSVLNRCARLMAAGHGGQTLLSDVTQELTRDTLPEKVSILSLGSHRLKDLERPEHVFQLIHPALPDTFPPLRTLDATPNNLPQQITSFVGRENVIADVNALLGKTRFLTLTASGGSGKTRISLQVAADVLETYPDGVWQAELAPLADPALVPQTVASVLGIKEQAGHSMTQTMTIALKDKRLLLLLDNCEHMLSACAQLVAAFLRSCSGVKVLATSREPLGIAGEMTYRVPSMTLPDPKQAKAATADNLSQFEAVRLFIERAHFVKPDFAVTNDNAPALAELCFRLDGIPLALELAAARVRSLAVEQITDKLDSRFRLLTGGDRSALPRQQTLRALVDWSYDLLSDSEKALLARLSVFVGVWTLEAAESVCGYAPLEDWETLDLLSSLVDKSLVLADEEESGTKRYRMLQTLRQYATEKREASGETADLQMRHVAFFVALAEEAEPKLWGPDQAAWLNRLETEHDNLRGALDACAIDSRDAPTAALLGLQLSGALVQFWYVRGYHTEGREHLSRALALRRAATSEMADTFIVQKAVARALGGLGTLAFGQGENDTARSHYGESLSISREIGDKPGVANTLTGLGAVANYQGDFVTARSQLEEGLSLYREIGDKHGVASALYGLGHVAMAAGDYVLARSHFEERLRVSREIGNIGGIAGSLHAFGRVAQIQGDFVSAQSLYEEGLSLFRETGNKGGIAASLGSLGEVAYAQGDYVLAWSCLIECLSNCREAGDKFGISRSLIGLGNVASAQCDYFSARSHFEEALRVSREIEAKFGIAYGLKGMAIVSGGEGNGRLAAVLTASAATLRQSIGVPLSPSEQAELDASVAKARAALSPTEFDAAWAEGSAMAWERAVELALAPIEGNRVAPASPDSPDLPPARRL